MYNEISDDFMESVAIIGMAGRFPGAKNVDEFWQNLCNGVEAITFLSDEEAMANGATRDEISAPNYVKAAGLLEGVDLFDASFFGFNPREAEIIDPQQRVFLECAWEALEDAAYDGDVYKGRVGVYGGLASNKYMIPVHFDPEAEKILDKVTYAVSNERDFLATRVSYKLNLKGPSLTIQTACSTSLVAVCMGCHSLLSHQSDMAIAGGVAIMSRRGYSFREGGITSPDGHCRAFDSKAKGTIFTSGAGAVVLKRLSDAMADGDHIYAVIKGYAVNNDGSAKIGYTAPSVDGQSRF